MPNTMFRFDARGPVALPMAALAIVLTLACVAPAARADHTPAGARAGLDLALAAARSWAPDARLIYIENDDPMDETGAATRWGYLFTSSTLRKARAYSVRDGRIVRAETLAMAFEAPPVPGTWVDSGVARRAADREVERDVGRAGAQGPKRRLSTMLLMRGVFDDTHPDGTTWTLVYTAPNQPSLFVVVDAIDGSVRKTWKG